MKKALNKSLFTAIIVAILSFVCAIMAFGYSNGAKTVSADTLIVPTEYTVAASDAGFTLIDGASVKTSGYGIKFGTTVTKAFEDALKNDGAVSFEYFATAKAVGGTVEQAKAFPVQPDFTTETEVELRTYLNFDSYSDNTESEVKAAYRADFTTSSFVKVTYSDSSVKYIKAYTEKTDLVRSMMGVGNDAVLNGEDGAAYIGEAVRSNDVTAYFVGNGKMALKMPSLENTSDTVNVYVGAEKHTASYDATRNVYTIASGAIAKYEDDALKNCNVSIFVGDNNDVYSTKAVEATEITTEEQLIEITNVGTSSETQQVTGNFVLGADITFSAAYGSYATFTGIFDGLGYSLTGSFAGHHSYNGLFRYASDQVTIKNLNVKATAIGNNSGTLIGFVNTGATLNVENCVVDVANILSASAPLVSVNKQVVNVKDTAIFVRSTAELDDGEGNGSILVWNNGYDVVNCDNVHVVFCSASDEATVLRYTSSDARVSGTTTRYRYFGEFYNALNADKISLPAEVVNGIEAVHTDVYFVDSSNLASTIQTTTDGYLILTEDVALTDTWQDDTSVEKKDFTFDGAGYSVSNIELSGTYSGFIGRTRNGKLNIVNANLHFEAFNNNYQALIGQNREPTLIYNTTLRYDKISGTGSGGITTMLDATGTYLNLKDVVMNIKETAASTNAGIIIAGAYSVVKTIDLDNVIISDASGVLSTLNGTTYQTPITGTLNEDYFWYKGVAEVETLGDSVIAGGCDDETKALLERAGLVVEVNQDNFGILQTVLSGYYYLTSNIDIAAYNTDNETTYSATQAQSNPFSGVFNGCGYTINNNTTNPVCVFSAVKGTFKNFVVKVANSFSSNSAAFAFITKGATTFENIVVDSAVNIGGYGCGSLLRSVQGETTFSNVVINATSVNIGDKAGFLAGGQADSAGIIVEKVYVVTATTSNLSPFVSVNGNIAYGVGGEEASAENGDYFVFASLEKMADAMTATENALVIDASLKTLLENSGVLVALNQDNIEKLMTATGGYWYLADDVDLTDVAWGPDLVFSGVLDGRNHKMSNISLTRRTRDNALFKEIKNATIKNVYIDVVGCSGNYAGCVAGVMRGTNTLSNVVIDAKNFVSYAGGTIAYYQEGDLNITNVLMMIAGEVKETQQGILTSNYGRDFNVSNFFILNENAALTDMFGTDNTDRHGTIYKADGSTAAVLETDYWYVTAKEDLPLATIQDTELANLLGDDFFS